MSTKTFLAISFPSMIVGSVIFGSLVGHADSGRDAHSWAASDSTIVAQADPRPARPAPPPAPRPVAPVAPVAPVVPDKGISVEIHDGKVTVSGLPEIVNNALRSAQDAINSSTLPKDAKDKLDKHIENIRTKITARLSHINITDLEHLGDQMTAMGDDISAEMEELGHEMEKYDGQLGKDFEKNLSRSLRKSFGPKGLHIDINGLHGDLDTGDGDDDDDKLSSPPDVDDDDELDDAVKDLGDLSLGGPQRDQIQKLRTASDRAVATAKKQLDQASDSLKKQLDNPATSDAEIARSIDAVTQQEAAIRKARILAWHDARRVLDEAQRKKVQDAAAKAKKHSK